MYEFTTRRRIEFADTDMGGIVHFARYFVFMETAEHEFLRELGTSVALVLEDGRHVGWPRVAATCEYQSPARYGDVLDVTVRVLRKGTKSLTYSIVFRVEGREVARGQVSAVCCELTQGRPIRSIPIPASIADRIEEAPPET